MQLLLHRSPLKSSHTGMEVFSVSCILIFAALIRIPSLPQPLGPDQGIMSVIGAGILKGQLPYKDYWEMGSPAIFYTYALMFKIFGLRMIAIPITDTIISMLTTLLVFILARSVWDKRVGYISALLFAFFSNGVGLGMHAGGDIAFGTFWYLAQRETFMLPLTVGAVYFMLTSMKRPHSFIRIFISAFLLGGAFVYKFPALIIALCLFLYLNTYLVRCPDHKTLKSLGLGNLAFLAGFILPAAAFALLFVVNGAFYDMTDVIIKYVFSVYGSSVSISCLPIIKMGLVHTLFLAKENFILWIFFIASSTYMIITDRTKENLLIVLWALASVLFVVSHREFFGYHYLMLLPPFCLLSAYGISRALSPVRGLGTAFTEEPGKAFILLAIFVNLAFFVTLNYTNYTKFWYYVTGRISLQKYYSFFTAYPKHDFSFPADYEVAQYISGHSDVNDMIYVIGGTESVIYFLSKRKSPSRFIFSWILFSPGSHGRAEQTQRYRTELLHDLSQKTPKYIVTIRPLDTFKQFPDIYCFLKSNYTFQKEFPDDRFLYAYGKNRYSDI